MLLQWARDHGVPLITNEGYGQNGTVSDDDETKLRWKCINTGVPVFTPAAPQLLEMTVRSSLRTRGRR